MLSRLLWIQDAPPFWNNGEYIIILSPNLPLKNKQRKQHASERLEISFFMLNEMVISERNNMELDCNWSELGQSSCVERWPEEILTKCTFKQIILGTRGRSFIKQWKDRDLTFTGFLISPHCLGPTDPVKLTMWTCKHTELRSRSRSNEILGLFMQNETRQFHLQSDSNLQHDWTKQRVYW